MADGNGRYLSVKNWSKFQHYKARSRPPWIKLYRALLTDYQFGRLADRDKAHLILIWLFAAQADGAVPNDPPFLRRRLGLQSNPNLELFINQGWLIENASTMLASCYQDASLEVEENRKEENRVETPKAFDIDTTSKAKAKAAALMARALAKSKLNYPT